jgi:NADH-quinone oxidoreductase subunit L
VEDLVDLVWLIPALPLAGFLLLVVFGRALGEPGSGWLATVLVGGSFAASVLVFLGLLDLPEEARHVEVVLFEWIPAGGLSVEAGFVADPLSITMALFVTGISALIHLYSIGYMHGDKDFSKFFVYLNLFVFSMLLLVLGNNLLVTFVGWEGVGTCSYLLISFWFTHEAKAVAGKKAFVTNRIGDFGFMLAMFLAFASVGTLQYDELLESAIAPVTATAIALLLFLGACGKSAQLPLYVWLPDAMAGPTPVSALIHAATMVTSGVFLMTRVSPLLAQAYDWAPDIIAWVGVGTALFAATIAVAQNDIKKVLAYSTISQLGYMFLAVGTGAYVAAVFHMVTHAFFKALLFLGSGSVIHGLHGEQDMRRMGGVRKWMPVTAFTFIIGWLAIAGVPPFAGFWSKDEILAFAFEANPALWAIGLATALLTAYYMSRQVFLVFYGEPRFDQEEAHTAHPGGGPHPNAVHPHESPGTMLTPLVVLAVLSVIGGGLNLPFSDDFKLLESWLHPVLEFAGEPTEAELTLSGATQVTLAVIATLAALIGIGLAVVVYLRRRVRPVEPAVLAHGWYYDEAVSAFMGGPGRAAYDGVTAFDEHVIDGAVNGTGVLVREGGARLRVAQTGYVRNYALGIAVGAVILVGLLLTQAGF